MNQAVRAGMELLETFFLVGWAGSIIVVIISGIEDLVTILKNDQNEPATAIAGDHHL